MNNRQDRRTFLKGVAGVTGLQVVSRLPSNPPLFAANSQAAAKITALLPWGVTKTR